MRSDVEIIGGGCVVSRRAFIGSLATSLLVAASDRKSFGSELSLPKAVAFGIPATDICSFAGVNLVAAAFASRFQDGHSDFLLAQSVIDIGTSVEPNLELLAELKPDIIVTDWLGAIDPHLTRIAPIIVRPKFSTIGDRYEQFADAVKLVAIKGKCLEHALAALDQAQATLTRLAKQLAGFDRAILLTTLNTDGASIRVYGPGGILGSTMKRLGQRNAWQGPDNIWGWTNIRPEQLRRWPDADIIDVAQYWDGPAQMRERIVRGSVWRELPQVKAGRVVTLPPISILGGLWTAVHFAELLASALTGKVRE